MGHLRSQHLTQLLCNLRGSPATMSSVSKNCDAPVKKHGDPKQN